MDSMNELKSVHRPSSLSASLIIGSRAKTPVVRGARACTVCRAAKVFNLQWHLSSLMSSLDEVCRRRRWTKAMPAMQARQCSVSFSSLSFPS